WGRWPQHVDLPYLPVAGPPLPRLQLIAREDPALVRHAPVIERLLEDDTGAASSTDPRSEHEQTRVFVAVAAAMIRLAERRPLLLVIDDLHWADRASLDLFTHLALEIADTALSQPVPLILSPPT